MLLTENALRNIIKEELKKVQKEGWSSRRMRAINAMSSVNNPVDSALQLFYSIYSKKQPSDFEKNPELKEIAKKYYEKYTQEFGKDTVDKYLNDNGLSIVLDYV